MCPPLKKNTLGCRARNLHLATGPSTPNGLTVQLASFIHMLPADPWGHLSDPQKDDLRGTFQAPFDFVILRGLDEKRRVTCSTCTKPLLCVRARLEFWGPSNYQDRPVFNLGELTV